jgi:hypothetical protein
MNPNSQFYLIIIFKLFIILKTINIILKIKALYLDENKEFRLLLDRHEDFLNKTYF